MERAKRWESFDDVREGIDHYDASLFVQEIALQCGHAMRAYRSMQDAIVSGDRIFEAWYHAQAMVSAAAAAAAILWPSTSRPAEQADLDALRRARGRVLREAIGVDGLDALSDRRMRDHLIHYDERLTRFVKEGHGVYNDVSIYPDKGGGPYPFRLGTSTMKRWC